MRCCQVLQQALPEEAPLAAPAAAQAAQGGQQEQVDPVAAAEARSAVPALTLTDRV
jgi:hypothetical protein